MTLVTFLSPDGNPVCDVEVPAGESLMLAALRTDVQGIEAECGGCATCGTCHVYVEQGLEALPPPAYDEAAMLEFVADERRANSRLSCQLLGATDLPALTVRLPRRQV
ncbi:2Fe-2S iron-sulfur cluster-binding protein [Ramlibacter sp. AN1015]|uniref:2Fe-2S iron-sulfur cluster-binding protein n=1 Tax=Ramlibacter sp. AN1015 TaxID=3133428 RepID=UPI0030C04C0F